MKKITLVACLAASLLRSQTNTYFQWGKVIPDTNYINAMVTNGGDLVSTGNFYGTIDFDPGPGTFSITGAYCAFVSKMDAAGNFIWAKHFTASGTPTVVEQIRGQDVCLGSNGSVYSTGVYDGLNIDLDPGVATYSLPSTSAGEANIYMSKLNSSGNFVWAKALEVNSNIYSLHQSIITDAQDNVYVSGTFSGTVDFDPGAGVTNMTSNGMEDIFILKLDASGNFLWVKTAGGAGSDIANDISVSSNGFLVTGNFEATIDLDPGTGITTHTASGFSDVFVLKLDNSGNYLWSKTLGNSSIEIGRGIVSNGIYGIFQGTLDADPGPAVQTLTSSSTASYFIMLDGNGNYVWAKVLPTDVRTVLEMGGNFYATGHFQGTIDVDPGPAVVTLTVSTGNNWQRDTWLIMLSSNGNFGSAGQITGSHPTAGAADPGISMGSGANIYLAGRFISGCDLDTSPGTFSVNAGPAFMGDTWLFKTNMFPTGINEQLQNELFSMQPNPATGQLTVNFNDQGLKTIDVINAIGQTVQSLKSGQASETLDVSPLPQGIYFVRITSEQRTQQTTKLIKH